MYVYNTQYEECEVRKLYIRFAVHLSMDSLLRDHISLFLKRIINLTVHFIWSLKTKWYPLDVSRFCNTGCEAVCIDTVLKLLFCYFNVSKASLSLFLAVDALYSPGYDEKSIYFVSSAARCEQKIKSFLRENVHVTQSLLKWYILLISVELVISTLILYAIGQRNNDIEKE